MADITHSTRDSGICSTWKLRTTAANESQGQASFDIDDVMRALRVISSTATPSFPIDVYLQDTPRWQPVDRSVPIHSVCGTGCFHSALAQRPCFHTR